MTLAELKNQIETGTVDSSLIVFKINKDDFIPKQYVEEMSRVLQMDIEYLSGIEALCVQAPSLFGEDFEVPTTLRVYCTDKFDVQSSALTEQKRLVIITKDVTDASMQMYKNHIIEVPNLVEWQIKDYAYSLAEGVNGKDIDWLLSLYGKNIYRLYNELSKISIFSQVERQYLFNDLRTDGAYTDVSSYNIFNITNAIAKRDINALKAVYTEMSRMDVSEFGLLALLLKNFKNIMMVQMQRVPTAESCLMDSKQFYAVSNLPRVYSHSQLVEIFTFLCDIDRQVKTGEISTDILIDYMIIKILSM